MQELIKYLEAIHPLSDGCKKYIEDILKTRHLKKGQYLVKPGQPAGHVYYLKKGLLRTYYKNADRKEVSLRFICPSEFITIMAEDLRDKRVSHQFIQALQPSDLIFITYKEEHYLVDHFPEYNYIVRVLYQQFYTKVIIPRFYMRNLPKATQRYAFLVRHQPELIHLVPLKHLASYLGITDYSLSRIRSEITDRVNNVAKDKTHIK